MSQPAIAYGNSPLQGQRRINFVDRSHLCHLKTCIWMTIALIHAGNVNLTKWSMYIPCRGRFAQSRAQIGDLPVVA